MDREHGMCGVGRGIEIKAKRKILIFHRFYLKLKKQKVKVQRYYVEMWK